MASLKNSNKFEIALTPDPLQAEEMGDVLLDDTIGRDARFIITYETKISNDNADHMDIDINVTLHSGISEHFRYANLRFTFPNNITIKALNPTHIEEYITIDKSEEHAKTVTAESNGINGTIEDTKTTTYQVQQAFKRIAITGINTEKAIWTLEVSENNPNGISQDNLLKITIPKQTKAIDCKLYGTFLISRGILGRGKTMIMNVLNRTRNDYENNLVFKIDPQL